MDQHAAFRCLLGVVALCPDAGVLTEISGAKAFALGIVPKTQWHGGKVPSADQLTFLADQRLTVRVPDLHGHAQALALDLPAPHR
ncbi:hypothetical protein D3C79_724030 [compost metagenome]